MKIRFLNNNQFKVRKIKMRIPVSQRPPKVINPKKNYDRRQNKDLIEEGLLAYENEKLDEDDQ